MDGNTDLAGVRILLDTYNLRLAEGSGIKTYALTLFNALQQLNATVSLLGDLPKRRTRYRELDEVLLYDVRRPMRRWSWTAVPGFLSGLRGVVAGAKADSIELRRVIPDSRLGAISDRNTVYNVPHCYRLAHAAYRCTHRPTRVKLPNQVDVWHATCPLPLRIPGTKMVTTIHDLTPLRLPYTTLDNKQVFYRLVRDAIRASAVILAVSDCTKRDILDFFDVPEEKVLVTYQAVPAIARVPGDAIGRATLQKYKLEKGNYILFVGNIEPKKNVITLIHAVSALDIETPLVIVGRRAWLWQEQLRAAKRLFGSKATLVKRLRLLGYVASSDLSVLYANASCFVFPSLYEGFGLPPLEAMRHGCPVISSNAGSLPEVCGNAALYVDPRDPDQICEKITLLLRDEAKRSELIEAGFKQVEYFSMERYAQRLLAAYSKVLS